MFARVASFEGGDVEKLQQLNEERMNAGTMELPEGLRSAMVLQDHGSGRRLFVTMFDSREAVEAAQQRFESMGDEIPEEIRGRRTSVDVYEVVWQQDAKPRDEGAVITPAPSRSAAGDRSVEAPDVEAGCRRRLVDDEIEAVAEVERHVPLLERLEVAGVSRRVRTPETVLEEHRPEAGPLVLRVDAEQPEVPVRAGRRCLVRPRDRREELVEPVERHLGRQVVETGRRQPLGRLDGLSRTHPGRDGDEPGEMVDEPEEAVVPHEGLEHQRRETSALALVRIQVSRPCVVGERTRDGCPGLTGVLGCQRQYGYDPPR